MLKVILISVPCCLLLHVNAADDFNSEYIYEDETLNFNNYNNNYDINYNLTTIITPLSVLESSLTSSDGNENLTAGMDSRKMDHDLDIHKQQLQFPKIPYNQDFHISDVIKSANYSFYFNFLHVFIQFVQPYDIPSDLLKDILENRVTTSKLITESMHMEVGLLILVGVCSILACVIPGTELWLACRPIREDYKPTQYPGFLTFVLYILAFILGLGMAVLILFNELTNMGMEKIPKTIDQAIDDLNNYHSGTTVQFRKCLTRSLDVASEAIMADLDNIDELLGKPVQIELSYETGLENTLTQLLDVANEAANLKEPTPKPQDPAASDDKTATSELVMVVNAAESENLNENLPSDDDKAIKDLIKLLADKKEANVEETLNFVIPESEQAINDPKVANFEILASNNQDLAISDDKKIFNKVIAALSNGEAHVEEPASDYQDLAAVDDDDDDDDDDDKVAIADVIIVVNIAKSANPGIVEANTDISTIKNLIETFVDAKAADLEKTASKDDEDIKNKGSSVKLITNNDEEVRAVNDLLNKALVSPKVANLEERALDLKDLILNDDVKSMGDLVDIINVLKIANLQENPTGNTKQMTSKKENIIDDNFNKLSSFEYYPDIIKDLENDLKLASDQEKGDYDVDKYFFYDIDEPVGYEYYPVVAKKVDDKKKAVKSSVFSAVSI